MLQLATRIDKRHHQPTSQTIVGEMATNIDIGSIHPFDCKGNPTSVGPRWRRWKRSFEFFLEAKGLSKDSQRTALLLHCAGQDVQDIFDTLTDPGPVPDGDTEYAKAMRSLDGYFFPQVNIPFERHEFRQAKQDESETADQFVMKLFQLSEHCEFGEAKEEHIRDQLIDKCKSHNLRKKLLEAGGTLTLQKAREIARSMEAAERQAKQIENDSRGGHVHTLEDHHQEGEREAVVTDVA